jgi:hypothetical protein
MPIRGNILNKRYSILVGTVLAGLMIPVIQAHAAADVRIVNYSSQHVAGHIFQIHYLVTGTIKNYGDTESGPITLELTITDHGEVVERSTFTPDVSTLAPGSSTTFSAPFSIDGFRSDVLYHLNIVSQ